MTWISVKDRLPPINRVVLVSYPLSNGMPPNVSFGGRADFEEGWCWGICYGGAQLVGTDDIEVDDDYPVTHWMDLQAPPRNTPGDGELTMGDG